MAKKTLKTKGAAPVKTAASLDTVDTLPVVTVPTGGTLRVVVDVGPMTIPYTVAYAGRNVIKSLVDRAEKVEPLHPGDHLLAWAFSHTEKGWEHAIGVSVNDGPVQLLERKSEKNKDADHSLGAAIIRA